MEVSIRRLSARDTAAFEPEFGFSDEAFFLHPGSVAVGAFAQDKAVGLAWGYLLPRPDGAKMFFLYAMDVLPPQRGQGIGTALIGALCAAAGEAGCRKLFLLTEESNKAACRACEKAGLAPKNPDDRLYEKVFDGKK